MLIFGGVGIEVIRGFYMGVEPKIGGFYPQNGWWKSWKTLLKWDDLGVPLFLETPIYKGHRYGKILYSAVYCIVCIYVYIYIYNIHMHICPCSQESWACRWARCYGKDRMPSNMQAGFKWCQVCRLHHLISHGGQRCLDFCQLIDLKWSRSTWARMVVAWTKHRTGHPKTLVISSNTFMVDSTTIVAAGFTWM